MKPYRQNLKQVVYAPTIKPNFITADILFTIPDYTEFVHNRGRATRVVKFFQKLLTKDYYLVMRERIVEVPFAIQNLGAEVGGRVLEFGCYGSTLSMQLASLGYQVTGADLRNYELKHPNFKLAKGDFVKSDLPANSFDSAIAISAVEHAGLGVYNDDPFADGDGQIVNKIHEVLKPGGRFILTVPYGKSAVTPHQRIYGADRLGHLLSRFKIRKESYFRASSNRSHWMPATKQEMAEVDSVNNGGWVAGVACIACDK